MTDCDWKVVYASLSEAEDAYWRTPTTKYRYGALLPYWCEPHGGFHLGHFDTLGQRAFQAWGAQLYNVVNAHARRKRKAVYQRSRFAEPVSAPSEALAPEGRTKLTRAPLQERN